MILTEGLALKIVETFSRCNLKEEVNLAKRALAIRVLGTPSSAVAMVVQFPVHLLAATSKIFSTKGVSPSFLP